MNLAATPDDRITDLAIIGAGPAGLAAAITAREIGLSVTVLDEQSAPGGQIYRAVEDASGRARVRGWAFNLNDYGVGSKLVARFRSSGAHYCPGQSVFDISADGGIGVLGPAGARWVEARRVLIATGAMERPVPVPGWTLPGVMGAGAVQATMKSAGLVPDGRAVIAGCGPLVYLVAHQLLIAGGSVAGVLDTTPHANYRRAAPSLVRAALSGNEVRRGLAWRRGLKKRVAVFRTGVDSLQIEGTDTVEAISFKAGGRRERLACDMVLLHEGVVPSTQLAMAAGAEHDYDPLQACWRPRVDDYGRTSVPGILVAGDGARIDGAELAVEAGHLAALAAAVDLDLIAPEEAARQGAAARAKIARKAPLRRFLDMLYRPRDEVLAPPDDGTIVCRCEEVTAGELRQVAAMGCPGPNQAKAFTRCGMGPCQGRMCGLAAAAILAEATGQSVAETGHLRVRAPIKPITVGELAALEGVGAPPEAGPLLPTAPDDGEGA